MSMFDSIINESNQEFGLGNKAENLLPSLLTLITDQSQGGFAGFLDLFRRIGLSDAVDSWIGKGANLPLTGEQVESALGNENISEMAKRSGLEIETTRTALGKMIPGIVDQLTPDAAIPTESDLLSRIGGYLAGVNGATISTTGVMESPMVDRFGSAAAEEIRQPNPADIVAEELVEENASFQWLLPLIILILLILIGWAFCGNSAVEAFNSINQPNLFIG